MLHLQELIWTVTTEDKIELPDTRILFLYLSFGSHVTWTNVAASPFLVCLPCTFMLRQCNVTHVYCLQFRQSSNCMRMRNMWNQKYCKTESYGAWFYCFGLKELAWWKLTVVWYGYNSLDNAMTVIKVGRTFKKILKGIISFIQCFAN